jgi:ceramide glucosyltransferase
MLVPALTWSLLAAVALTWLLALIAAGATVYLLRRPAPAVPTLWPSFSILKPLAGLDDELELNLASHLAIDYPGKFELVLGVRDLDDPAYPIAKAFAQAHPAQVRLVLQEGEPGLNPKVNQLLTLTRYAKYEVIALTDASVRVPPQYLREHAAYLLGPKVALTSNGFYGEGEATLGSAFDNMTLASFVLPNLAAGDVLLRMSQIVSKSLAIRREALELIGGWETLKDLLAEDQRLGAYLAEAGFETVMVPSPVCTIQKTGRISRFYWRQARWAMIRFKLLPAVHFEVLLNPTVVGLLFALSAPRLPWAWAVLGANLLLSMGYTQVMARLARGRGFALKWIVLAPLRDLLQFAAWLHGRFLQTVSWRGHVLRVGTKTKLTRPDAVPKTEPVKERPPVHPEPVEGSETLREMVNDSSTAPGEPPRPKR